MLLKDLIVTYRNDHGLSQRAFASKCGVTNGYISMIEKGSNPSTDKPITPGYATLKNLANGMDMSLHQLIAICDDMEVDISEEYVEEEKALSAAAQQLAAIYDSLDDAGKELLDQAAAFARKHHVNH